MSRPDGQRPNNKPPPARSIASVDNALTLLEMVASQESVRISDAGRALGVVPSTASRLMAMLQYHDFVVHDPESRVYRAGPALARLGLNAIERMSVRRLALPFVERLARELDETVHFVVLDGASVLFLDGVESGRAVRTTRRRGELRPAHCTSGGKAMLAALTRDDLLRRYPQRHLPPCTAKSVTTRDELERELTEIKIRGYATSIQESEPDIAAIGAAVVTVTGKLIGALTIAVPTTRYDPATFANLSEPLLQIAAEAGEKLAFAELLDLSHE